jgi:glycosyltransferase involved in cell wall biosynthesis
MSKQRILAWSDAANVKTGFANVSAHVLRALHNTGLYEIEQLAINHTGKFTDKDEVPWEMLPARLNNPDDVYGKGTFLRLLQERDYDFVWMVNDSFIVYDLVEDMKKIFSQRKSNGQKIPIVIYYYPVDCHIQENSCQMIKFCDIPVAYNKYGIQETLKTLPELKDKLQEIYHGTDAHIYKPLPQDRVRLLKTKYYGDRSNHFIVLNVNRNSDRKQLTHTIWCFSKFKKLVPDSLLMLHTVPIDQSFGTKAIDLFAAIKDAGLNLTDVLIPKHYRLTTGYPVEVMNELYNTADVFISNHLGEGWGLSLAEAMSAGTPVIVPDNTNMKELFGSNSERGYIYPCKDVQWIDNCYTPDTEVLTKAGWKFFKDTTASDEFCTMNPETHVIEYHKPEQLIEGDYKDNLYSLKHEGNLKVDILVTKNHNIYAKEWKQSQDTDWKFFKPEEILGRKDIQFKKDAKWTGKETEYFELPPCFHNNGNIIPAKRIPMLLWMEFMGYYLSEGSTTIAEQSHYIVQLRQNPGSLFERMFNLVQQMGYNVHANRQIPNSRLVIYDKQLYDYLKILGKKDKKYIPRDLFDCSREQLRILFEAMMAGDGHNLYYRDLANRNSVHTKGGSSYATTSIRLRDDFQELLLKIGYSGAYRLQSPAGIPWNIEGRSGVSNYDLWVIGISYSMNTPSKRGCYSYKESRWTSGWKEEWIPYDGKVYCAVVPNHLMFVRRNGCVLWSGNSGFRKRGYTEDIVEKLYEVYKGPDKFNNPKTIFARKWIEEHTWEGACKLWIDLFANAKSLAKKDSIPSSLQGMLVGEQL